MMAVELRERLPHYRNADASALKTKIMTFWRMDEPPASTRQGRVKNGCSPIVFGDL